MEAGPLTDAPKLTPKCYAFVGGSALPVLDSFEELAEKLDDAAPDDWIEVTVNVQQPEVQAAQANSLFAALIGVTVNSGFTRARYRAHLFNGYVQVLQEPREHQDEAGHDDA